MIQQEIDVTKPILMRYKVKNLIKAILLHKVIALRTNNRASHTAFLYINNLFSVQSRLNQGVQSHNISYYISLSHYLPLLFLCNLTDLVIRFIVGGVDHDACVHVVSDFRNVEIGTSLHQIFGIDHQLKKCSGEPKLHLESTFSK